MLPWSWDVSKWTSPPKNFSKRYRRGKEIDGTHQIRQFVWLWRMFWWDANGNIIKTVNGAVGVVRMWSDRLAVNSLKNLIEKPIQRPCDVNSFDWFDVVCRCCSLREWRPHFYRNAEKVVADNETHEKITNPIGVIIEAWTMFWFETFKYHTNKHTRSLTPLICGMGNRRETDQLIDPSPAIDISTWTEPAVKQPEKATTKNQNDSLDLEIDLFVRAIFNFDYVIIG